MTATTLLIRLGVKNCVAAAAAAAAASCRSVPLSRVALTNRVWRAAWLKYRPCLCNVQAAALRFALQRITILHLRRFSAATVPRRKHFVHMPVLPAPSGSKHVRTRKLL
jgi:hypothetical protein